MKRTTQGVSKPSEWFNCENDSLCLPKKKASPLTEPLLMGGSTFQKAPMIYEDSQSKTSTRTTSVSSLNTVSSMSSVESSFSNSFFAQPPLPRKSLQRAKTTVGYTTRLTHSLSTSAFDLKTKVNATQSSGSTDDLMKRLLSNINDNDINFVGLEVNDQEEDLERFCVPSPIAERTLVVNDSTGMNKRDLGSPLQKKPIRSKVRRTHSMFYSKKEITETTKTFANVSSNDDFKDDITEDAQSQLEKSKIEVFYIKNDLIPRINVETLCKILDGHYQCFYENITVVDCRFEYEYKGGHINGSVNVSSQQELEDKFLHNRSSYQEKKQLIVFHCEFSSYRGPLMASHLRTCDRNMNQDKYPHLDYPDILVLEGGYKSFFDCQPNRCFPQKYVEMNDDNHKYTCEKELTKFRRALKRASSFNSLSYTASLSQQTSTTVTSSSASSLIASGSRAIHRRTSTSSAVTFNRRPSLKSNSLDISRTSLQSLDSALENNLQSKNNDENKPPAALDFGFRFPIKTPIETVNSPTGDVDEMHGLPRGIIKKKLSRSFTTLNM